MKKNGQDGETEDISASVKSLTLRNVSTAVVAVNLWYIHWTSTNYTNNTYRRRISPVTMSLGPGQVYADTDEITLGPGDRIIGNASAASAVEYALSGIERDA